MTSLVASCRTSVITRLLGRNFYRRQLLDRRVWKGSQSLSG